MKNEDIILGIVRDNSNKLIELNREVGEIKTELSTRHKSKVKGYTKVGLFISSGILLSKLIDMVGIL